jgi:hypothetical protein
MDPLSLINQVAPSFVLPDRDGTLHQLEDWRGRLVILVFWSPDCPHAVRLDEHLRVLARQGWGDVALLRIAGSLDGVEGERCLLDDLPSEVILVDEAQQVADMFCAQVTPHVVVLDAAGIVRYSGAPDDATLRQRTPTRSYLSEALEAIRSGQLPEFQTCPAFGCAIVRRHAPPRAGS